MFTFAIPVCGELFETRCWIASILILISYTWGSFIVRKIQNILSANSWVVSFARWSVETTSTKTATSFPVNRRFLSARRKIFSFAKHLGTKRSVKEKLFFFSFFSLNYSWKQMQTLPHRNVRPFSRTMCARVVQWKLPLPLDSRNSYLRNTRPGNEKKNNDAR